MNYILQTNHLTKKYKDKYAVKQINMNIKKGEIYGLIGKNGAGKTTLMRLITGLSIPTGGSIQLFGNSDLSDALKRTGCIIENPSLYPNMTASQNLEYYCSLLGIVEKDSVTQLLDMVGLRDVGKKKIKQYSLGMKQRLAIAIALLGHPDFLVLDEPINGLDPTGIKDIRNLLMKLNNEQGISILISSHILGELSKMATNYGIMHNGTLIEEFSAKELEVRCKRCLKIQVDNEKTCAVVLEKELNTTNFDIPNRGEVRLFEYLDEAAKVNQCLTNAGVLVEGISLSGEDLESYFMERMEGRV